MTYCSNPLPGWIISYHMEHTWGEVDVCWIKWTGARKTVGLQLRRAGSPGMES